MHAERITIVKPPSGRIKGNVVLPGSKSLTNRALLVAAQSSVPFIIDNASDSEDSAVVSRFLQQLGYNIGVHGNEWSVAPPADQRVSADPVVVDLHEAGTAMRFITAFCCTCAGTFVLTGTERLCARPIAPLVQALQKAGAAITYLDKQGFLPIRMEGKSDWTPQHFSITAAQSSQFVTALLLLAPRLPLGSTIEIEGTPASEPYIRMTVGLLQALGIIWHQSANQFVLRANTITQNRYRVESDWSAASYMLALAATIQSDITLQHLTADSLQGDADQLEIFVRWGLQLSWNGEESLHVQNPYGSLLPKALEFDFGTMPDVAQTFAVLAAWATGVSNFSGLHTLPLKEADRIHALATELRTLGVYSTATYDALIIQGGTMRHTPHAIHTHNDHRMAMSFAVAANLLGSITLESPQVVRKSYPRFWEDLKELGYGLQVS